MDPHWVPIWEQNAVQKVVALESPGLRRPSNMRKASFLSLWVSVSLASDLDFVAKYNPYQEPMAARSVSFYILYIRIEGTIS